MIVVHFTLVEKTQSLSNDSQGMRPVDAWSLPQTVPSETTSSCRKSSTTSSSQNSTRPSPSSRVRSYFAGVHDPTVCTCIHGHHNEVGHRHSDGRSSFCTGIWPEAVLNTESACAPPRPLPAWATPLPLRCSRCLSPIPRGAASGPSYAVASAFGGSTPGNPVSADLGKGNPRI